MRKLFTAVVVVFVFAIAFTLTASAATGDKVWTPENGKYSITYDLSEAGLTSVADDTMFGMLVVDDVDINLDELDDDDIKYIDQANADDGSITFSAFTPMSTTADNYRVYIGGGTLAATKIGTLSKTAAAPATYDVIFMADGAQVAKITKNVGETLTFAEFPTVPAKAGFTGVWSVTTDITAATTVTAIYTEDSTGDDDDDTTVLYGDVNGDGQIKNNDLSTLARHIAEWPDYPLSIINQANADVTADGQIKNGDLSALARHIAEWPDYLTLPYVK